MEFVVDPVHQFVDDWLEDGACSEWDESQSHAEQGFDCVQDDVLQIALGLCSGRCAFEGFNLYIHLFDLIAVHSYLRVECV